MKKFEVRFSKKAKKDVEKLSPKLKFKLKQILLESVSKHPYDGKKLMGDLEGFFSVRLTYQDRIVYSIDEKAKIIYIHRTRTNYGD